MATIQTGIPIQDCVTAGGTLDIEQAIADDRVAYDESTYEHDDPDHCEAAATGRVVVGVVNDQGEVLLTIDEDRGYAFLPNGVVESDDLFLDVARETVEQILDTSVSMEAVHRVRRIDHLANGQRQQQTTHVVVSANPAETPERLSSGPDGLTPRWCEELPAGVEGVGDAVTDIRIFLPD